MNTISLIVLVALLLVLAYYVLMLAVRIRTNVLTGQSFHDALITEISEMRMGKMMDALGINKEKYIHQQSVLDISKNIEACKSCGNTAECDEKMETNDIQIENIGFCENEEKMAELVFEQDEREEIKAN